MKVELILPIECLKGMLHKRDKLYFRLYKGQQLVQRCPNRDGYVPTEKEKAGQYLFAERNRVVAKMLKEGTTLTRKEIWTKILNGEIHVES